MTLPPVHTFQPAVEQLREDRLRSGSPVTHAQALQLVAQAQGARTWDQLQQAPRLGWFERRIRGAQSWKRDIVFRRDELLFDLKLNRLCLGLEALSSGKELAPVEVADTWARRGVLLVGPNGKGAVSTWEHYAAQQIARDAGLLVLDASPNLNSPRLLGRIAEVAGRPGLVHYRHDLENGLRLTDVGALFRSKGLAYVSLPWKTRDEAAQQAAFSLVSELAQAAQPVVSPLSSPWPFMVVVPEGGWLLTPDWLPFLQYSRSLGIMLVLRLHSLDELSFLPSDCVEAALNLGCRLFLEPASEGALTSASRLLARGPGVETESQVRKRLSSLGLGAALLHPWDGVRPKLVRLCMVDEKSRSEAHAGP